MFLSQVAAQGRSRKETNRRHRRRTTTCRRRARHPRSPPPPPPPDRSTAVPSVHPLHEPNFHHSPPPQTSTPSLSLPFTVNPCPAFYSSRPPPNHPPSVIFLDLDLASNSVFPFFPNLPFSGFLEFSPQSQDLSSSEFPIPSISSITDLRRKPIPLSDRRPVNALFTLPDFAY